MFLKKHITLLIILSLTSCSHHYLSLKDLEKNKVKPIHVKFKRGLYEKIDKKEDGVLEKNRKDKREEFIKKFF